MTALGDQYGLQLLKLHPPGAAWPRDPSTVRGRFWAAIGDGLARIEAAALALLDEADPRTTVQMIPEWYEQLGIVPGNDEFIGYTVDTTEVSIDTALVTSDITLIGVIEGADADLTVPEQQAFITAQVNAVGGQTKAYFIGLAASLGYTITITTYRRAVADVLAADTPIWGDAWCFAWTISVTAAPAGFTVPLRADAPGSDPGRNSFERLIRRVAPAHTYVLFDYESL
ncbi:MAG TPA: putative phage tail protein [Aliidongia sp.]|uniref:putative phage tail protein n=1 Tax=Aliidongia sp. TaxID=1914230 RepID=UPI002DDCD62A|nr:putative phage tail protein [Aliidongia sp.]HEV2674236.1 putative phage tail protein [Aliidongia sp.]